MIITRTPFRVSFFGGGTDYPLHYKEHGGAVLSTSINKYCYISCRYLPPFFDFQYLLRYHFREEVNKISEIEHPSVRECLKFLKMGKGIEMVHTGDIPALSGIGSSSAFTVGFLNTLYALKGRMVTKRQLASEAIHVEQVLIKENVGSQDQVAAAFGGINKIEFGGNKEFFVHPLTISNEKLDYLQNCLMFFFTGLTRRASEIVGEQIKNTPNKKKELRTIRGMVGEAVNILDGSIDNYEDFGRLMHEQWKIKKDLSRLVTTPKIDEIYNTALKAGAIGGKLCGAGGGGFMILFAKPEDHPRIKEKLKNLLLVPINFEMMGSQTIVYQPNFSSERNKD